MAQETEAASVHVAGEGTFQENVEAIVKMMAKDGWCYVQTVIPLNDSATVLFERPKRS